MNKSSELDGGGRRLPRASKDGFALVLVLSVLILVLLAVFAFFMRAQTSRMLSSASTSNQLVEILATAAVDRIEDDLIHEMKAGSEDSEDPEPGEREILNPRLVDSDLVIPGSNSRLSLAPGMAPQRVVDASSTAPATLVKQSLHSRPFFSVGDDPAGWDNANLPPIPDRASPVNTASDGAGRVPPARWEAVGLTPTGSSIAPPDWIYLDRGAETPTEFSAGWADRSANNTDAIIGRFAYNIYDVGGLLDLNVLGNLLPSEENGHRGRLHQVSLAGASGPLEAPNFSDFVEWRSENDLQTWEGEGALGDPTRDFLTAPAGTQRFPTRKDLLRYLEQGGTLPQSLSAYATVFTRDISSPSYQPEPNRPMLPAGGNGDSTPEELNPILTEVRFETETNLSRGTDPEVTVPAGTPVMARRFPLGKLDLLADESADPDDLEYYFGLERQADGSFEYTAAAADGQRIKRLEEVAAEGREPNFFEVLQAVIVTGSLGRNAGNTSTIDQPRDSLRNLQVMQIGANIVDQWDADDFPTEIKYPSGVVAPITEDDAWLTVYGTENLPYINSMEFVGHSPAWQRSRLQLWMLFSVWNPHQNADEPAEGIEEFRIVAASGRVAPLYIFFWNAPARLMQRINSDPGERDLNTYMGFVQRRNDPAHNDGFSSQSIVQLNENRALTFPNNASYSEPRVLGGNAPQNDSDRVGLLLNEITTSQADASSSGVEYVEPIVPEDPLEVDDPIRDGVVSSTNGRQFPGVNDILEQVLRDELLESEDREPTPQEIADSRLPPDGNGFFGAKAFNYFRLFGVRDDRPTFHLQYREAGSGEWKTYQVVDRLFPGSGSGAWEGGDPQTRGHSAGFDPVTHGQFPRDFPLDEFAETVTLPSAASAVTPEERHFFGWRRWETNSPGSQGHTMVGAFKADPRSIRFGHSSQNPAGATLGPANANASQARSIMSMRAPFNWRSATSGGFIEGNPNWKIAGGASSLGPARSLPGMLPDPYPDFEWFNLPLQSGVSNYGTFAGLTRNIPEGTLNDQTNPSRYRDRDGIIRPADGYLGAIPTLAIPGDGSAADRPLILNRAFRSVGELGYVFRDLPWKSIDFFSRSSGDLGLLDAFSLEEPERTLPLIAGKVNLNSAPEEVLAALLLGSFKDDEGLSSISGTEANEIAEAIVAERNARGPFRDAGDLVRRALAPVDSTNPGAIDDTRKQEREAAIRTLAALGTTRTWNLLIDLVVQSGHMKVGATAADQFIVRAERHYWVHLAMDRLTGEILDEQWESVDD